MVIKTRIVILSFLMFIVYGLPPVTEAGTTGKIRGTVRDAQSGDPLPGVNVIIEGTTMGASTSLEGIYLILNVRPGIYTLKASMMGYGQMRVEKVRVSVDYTTTIGFELEPAVIDMGEVVTITAERPLVRLDLTSTAAIVGAEEIAEMPVEEFSDVLVTIAGVVKGADNSMHIRGGRASEIVYMIDGVAVSNPFWGGSVVEVENTAIQEIQVISGTFNAEYGQAMAGIVNIVTKEGSPHFSGKLSAYLGDYVSNRTEQFLNIDEMDPLNFKNVDYSLSGPVPLIGGQKLTFFTSGRYYKNEGWLYGIREHTPFDSVNRDDPDRGNWYIEKGGNSAIVSMNPFEKLSLQGKITWRPFGRTKLSYGVLGDRKDYKTYTHNFKYNPDGDYQHNRSSYNQSFTWTQTLSAKAFFDLKFSHTYDSYNEYVYEDPLDPRYVNDTHFLRSGETNNFYFNGQGMWHYDQDFNTYVGRFDLTSQMHKNHEIKMGAEAKVHDLYKHDYKTVMEDRTGWEPVIDPPLTSVSNNEYRRHPKEAAFYIQDKIELTEIILNLGLRYDYFDPAARVPIDLEDPDLKMDEDRSYYDVETKKARVKHQFSPRLGIAYPITDRGAIHFSYGHFFQIPPFAYLYANPEFEVVPGYLGTLMGNADLMPQQTVIYEIGLQQQLTENIGMDVTGFYRDINYLLSSGLSSGIKYFELPGGTFYSRYANEDYANVKGITLTLTMRRRGYLSGSLDYTYQVAEGNASEPTAAFYDLKENREPEKKVVPLNWDQTHTLNFTANVSVPDRWGVSVLGRLMNGLPYTPSPERLRGIGGGRERPEENSGRKLPQFTFDMQAYKDFRIGGLEYTIFLKVYNLFDYLNERYVYNDTGRAGYSLVAQRTPDYSHENPGLYSVMDYYNRPYYYREPREVRLGMSFEF